MDLTGYRSFGGYIKGKVKLELSWLFNVAINDISVIHVTAHRCAGGLKKKLDLRSGSQRHRHFAGFFNAPVLAPTRDHPLNYLKSDKQIDVPAEQLLHLTPKILDNVPRLASVNK